MIYQKQHPETIRFKKLEKNNKEDLTAMSKMATSIVKEHFDPLVGPEQNDYMIAMFQTEKAIAGQLDAGYEYYFVLADTEVAGFLAFYEDAPELHLSKFYLYKHMRGRGYARAMQKFVVEAAKEKGLEAIALNVNRNNSSVQVYQALGYHIARKEVNAIGHGYVMDDFVMRYDMKTINLSHAYQAFEQYLEAFDRENDKIKLKIIHTYGVVHCAKEITRRMNLPEEDCALAELIALLHDIGRFEQVRRFDSFERSTMDHAAFGVELLFGNLQKPSENGENVPFIRKFIPESDWDEIIKISIAKHSLYELDKIEDERIRLHAKIIRDADKLDNCRVKLEESLEVLLQHTAEEIGMQTITDKVWKSCLDKKSVISSDRVTKMDYWVSYLAYFFDINFPATFSIIAEEDYISRIIARIPYQNPDTKEKMQMLKQMLNEHILSTS